MKEIREVVLALDRREITAAEAIARIEVLMARIAVRLVAGWVFCNE